jgi:hypothetical protein
LVPYKFYESSYDFAGPYRLYGVTPGQEARAAVETAEMRKLGEGEIPICTAVSKYKSNYCYNDAKMEAHLVARNHKGDIAIVWPVNQRDMDSGFRFELVE